MKKLPSKKFSLFKQLKGNVQHCKRNSFAAALLTIFSILFLVSQSYADTYVIYPSNSPAQYDYTNNTYDELGWYSTSIATNGVVSTVSISYTWDTDSWPDEGSFYISSPSGTVATIGSGQTDGSYNVNLNNFNNENLNGTWILWIEDSYGDGGHQATNITVTFTYSPGSNMTYQSSNVYQITDPTGKGMVNQVILRIEVVMSGTQNPLSATSFSLGTTGTSNTSDITNAKLYYTGTSSTFATSSQFGSTINNPSGTFTITGSQQLQNGTNYFWLAYDIANNATIGNVVDAICSSITIGGTSRTPSTTSPSGSRPITYLKVYSESFDATTFPPTGWQNIKTGGTDTRVWDRVISGTNPSCSPHSGAGMAYYNSYSIPSGNSAALITPPIDWSQRGSYTPKVRFWMYRDPGYSSATQEGVTVYVNTSASTSGATQLGFVARYYSPAGWYYYEYSIPSGFNGSTNYILFNAYSQYGNNIFIDDISWDAYPSVMTYSSATTTQASTTPVGVGFTNQVIIRLEVTMNGAADPLSLTSITFNTTGSTNPSDIANAKVYYTGISSTFSTSTQFGSTVINPSGQFTVTGNQTLQSGTNYFWLTYDVASNATQGNFLDAQCLSFVISGTTYQPSVTAPAGNREIRGPRSGTYTVGTGQYYQTLTEAFSDMNTFGLQGNVTLLIMTDINETGAAPPTLNQWTEYGGSGYRLTIRPSGANRTIQGSYASTGVVVLYGADRVTIDGSISGSGRYLTIQNNTTSSTSAVVWIQSLGTGAGCNNVVIRNCNIVGAGNSSSFTSSLGIYAAGTSVSTSGTGADNDYLLIENNQVKKVYYGIYARGVATSGNLDSLIIRNNIVGADVSTEYVGYRGIDVQTARGVKIIGNQVYNIRRTDGNNISGIELGQYCQDAQIIGNKIYSLYQESSGGWGSYGINVSTSTGNSNILIANNMISDLHTMNYSVSSTTYNPFGIRLAGGTNYKIYHNTVYMYGTQANVGSAASLSACLLYTTSSVSGTDVRNNIFYNSLGSNISGSKMYAIYVPSGTSFSNINYNDYYVSGSYGILGYLGADKTTLSDWRTATGQDGNSINVQPYFVGNNDLHLTGSNIGDNRFLASALSSVSTDFDNETRRTSNVNMGADEVRPILSASPISFSPDIAVYCKDGMVTMSGGASISGYGDGISRTVTNPPFTYQWTKNSQNIVGATNQTFTLNPIVQSDSANYGYNVYLFGESATAFDKHLKVESPIAITSHPQNSDICADYNPTINLSSVSDGTILGWQWQKQDNNNPNVWNNIPGANQPNYIAPITDPETAAGNYRVAIIGPGNCGPSMVHSNVATVNVTETVKNNIVSCDNDPSNICEGSDFLLTTSATGSIYGFIWQKQESGVWKDLDLNKFPTATSRTLQFRFADPSMSGKYRVLVYGSQACYPDGQPVPSSEIDVTVWPLFRIVEQPQPQSLCENEDILLYIVTEGVVLKYQWQKDGVDITDNETAKSAVLIIDNAKFETSGVYRCRLTIQDCRGVVDVYTDEVLIYVHSKTRITKATKEQIVMLGKVAMFSFDVHIEGVPPSYNPEIQWFRGNQPLVDNDRISGSKSNILTIRDIRPSDLDSNYWVVASGKCGSDTAIGFSITAPDIVINTQPSNVQICEGESATFAVDASIVGGTSLVYQWRKDGQLLADDLRITGANTNTLKITNVMLADVGNYDVIITNLPSGFVKSSAPATLVVDVKPTITQQPQPTTSLNTGEDLTLIVDADGSLPLTYQWYKDNIPISGATNNTYTKTSVTSDDAGTYYCMVENACGSVKSNDAIVTVTFKVIAGGIANGNDSPNSFNSLLALPNPFNEAVAITFNSSEIALGKVTITDALGNEVAKLFEGEIVVGQNRFDFNPAEFNLGSGIYFCKLMLSNGKQLSTQLMYIK